MSFRPRRRVLLCGMAPILVTAILSLTRPAFLSNLEYAVYDWMVRAIPTRIPDKQVVIVDVDERSLATIGQWPWRRDLIGRLISRLRDLGASVVALDVVFAEADRYEGTGPNPDAMLAETLRGGKVILGYALTFDRVPIGSGTCLQHPVGLAMIHRGDDHPDDRAGAPFFHATGAICSLPVLTAAAGASGFLNAAPDPDGLLRRVPLLVEYDGRVYPALALAATVAITGIRDIALRTENVNTMSLILDNREVPLDGKSNLLLRYRGPKRSFRYVSAADVMSGVAGPEAFRDKIVFVGTTALGTREVVTTPVDTLFAGVEVQATVADNLLQQDFVRRPEYGVTLETQVVLALGIVMALLVGRLGVGWGAVGTTLCLAGAWTGALSLFSSKGVFLSPLFPTLGLTLGLSAMLVAWFTIERQRAHEARVGKADSQRLMVQALLSLTSVRDAETGRHSRRTQQYGRLLAQKLAANPEYHAYLTPERVELFASLAPLHDIGKVGVPDRLLNKPGPLTDEEMAEMRRHPEYGRDVILNAEHDSGTRDDAILELAKDIVYTHHEKWDGTGYPQGLRGTEIPIPGRMMAIVDVYDAVVARRLYRHPLSHADAVAFIVGGKGTHFDPAVVEAFVLVAREFERLSSTDVK